MATTRRRRIFKSMTNFRNHVIVYLLLLLISNSTILFVVQGRNVKLPQTTMVKAVNSDVIKEMKMRLLIGSRHPRCDKHKCIACGGHCEAVQLPIWPSTKEEKKLGYYTRQEVLDYKPMSWMCRCGNFYLNP